MRLQVLIFLLLGSMFSTFAAKPKNDVKMVITAFVESYLKHGDYKKLSQVLGHDVTFKSNRDTRVVVQQGTSVIDFMRKNAGMIQRDCSVGYEIVSKTSAIVVARVDIKYELCEGAQQNYLIIENDGTGDWKLTQVYKLFLENTGEENVTAGKV
ncbi:hypothetical protein [Pedobacter sp. SYP-B3415]|uniref:hypothetical protein n=1 Tax=Pedobacter sp. SYP-B3415 TaxID=2496641 RepID=UPI00101B73A7|nr:hypothetical protein [Pedobacter sp. SYP-B3415]